MQAGGASPSSTAIQIKFYAFIAEQLKLIIKTISLVSNSLKGVRGKAFF